MKSILLKTLREAGVYSLSPILQRMVGFFLIPLYTAYLSPADYGNLEYIITIVTFLTIIASGGLPTGFFRYGYGEEKRRRGEVLFNCILANLFLSVLIFLLALNFGVLAFDTSILFKLLLLYLIGRIAFAQVNYILLVLRYTHRAKLYVLIATVNILLMAGFNILFVAHYKMGLTGIVLSNLIVSVIVLMAFAYLFIDEIRIRLDWQLLKRLFGFGLPMVPGNIAALAMTMSDRFFLSHYSTAAELGLYGYGYKFGMIMNSLIIMPFFLGWGPYKWDVYKKMENAKEIYARFFGYFISGLLIAVIALNLALTFLGNVMTSNKEFTQGLVILPLILASYFFVGATRFQALGVLFKNRTYLVSVAVGIAAVINLILNFLLIPKYGMLGAAIATVVAYFAHFVIYYAMNQRYYYVDYNKKQLIGSITMLLVLSSGFVVMNYTLPTGFVYIANLACLVLVSGITLGIYRKEFNSVVSSVRKRVKRHIG